MQCHAVVRNLRKLDAAALQMDGYNRTANRFSARALHKARIINPPRGELRGFLYDSASAEMNWNDEKVCCAGGFLFVVWPTEWQSGGHGVNLGFFRQPAAPRGAKGSSIFEHVSRRFAQAITTTDVCEGGPWVGMTGEIL